MQTPASSAPCSGGGEVSSNGDAHDVAQLLAAVGSCPDREVLTALIGALDAAQRRARSIIGTRDISAEQRMQAHERLARLEQGRRWLEGVRRARS